MALKTQIRSLRFARDLILSQRCEGMVPYTPDPKPEYTGKMPSQRLPRSTPEKEGMSDGRRSQRSIGRLRRKRAVTSTRCSSPAMAGWSARDGSPLIVRGFGM